MVFHISAVMFWSVCMLLAPVVQTMNQYQAEKVSVNLMALSTIYPVKRFIHLSHNWALYFSQHRYTVSLQTCIL